MRHRMAYCGVTLSVLLVVGMLAACWQPACAQQVTAAITGTVIDPSGAAVAGATVTATDIDRGSTFTTKTNETGAYSLNRLPIGTYRVKTEATGFQTAIQPPLTLDLNQTARMNFQMKVGKVTESVEVSTAAPLLQTDTTSVNTIIDSKTNDNLPLATRNYVQLTLLAPGSVTPNPGSFNTGDNTASGGRPYINGNREQSNNFLLDGMDNNQVSDNLLGYTPTPDAIAEFNLITQNASAEFGNFQGGIVSTTLKSGTNSFHGDVWEFFRNDVFNANSWENKLDPTNVIDKPALRWNMFGATLGGPIIKNKLFFFADYQGQRFDHPSTVGVVSGAAITPGPITVFTAAERNGDFGAICQSGFTAGICNDKDPQTGATINQLKNPVTGQPFLNNVIPLSMENVVAKNLFASSLYPTPINGDPTRNAINTASQHYNTDQGDIKIDANLSEKDHLFGRYSRAFQNDPGSNSLAILGNTFSSAPIWNTVADWSHTFSPSLLNDVRFGVNYVKLHNGTSFDPSVATLGQDLGIANAQVGGAGLLALGFGGGSADSPGTGSVNTIGSSEVEQLFADTVIQFDDGLVITHGTHVFHVGFQLWRDRIDTYYSGNAGRMGSILFGGNQFTGNGLSDFFIGLPEAEGRGSAGGTWGQRAWTIAGYVQDDWRATKNLTLNLGLRYEAHTPWVEVLNRQANFDLTTGAELLAGQDGNSGALYPGQYGLRDFQPRLGFAWTPGGGRTVLRGAYTISSYLEGTGTNLRLTLNPPFSPAEIASTFTALGGPTTDQGIQGGASGNSLDGANLRVWSPDVQPAIAQQWNVSVQREITNSMSAQVGYVGQHGTHLMVPTPFAQKVLNPDGTVSPSLYFSQGTLLQQIGSGTVSGTASNGAMEYNALQAVLQKRYSSGLQTQVAYTLSKCMTNSSGYYGSWGAEAAPASPYWQNLYDPNAEWARCYYDSKNVLTAYAVYELPIGHGKQFGQNLPAAVNAVVGNWSVNPIVSWHSGFPLALYAPSDVSGTGSRGPRPNCNGAVSYPKSTSTAGLQWFDPSAFSLPTSGFGNCPASGPVMGPGYSDVDLGLQKNFPISERKNLQFRADFLNAFNHPNFNVPDTNVGDGTTGIITTTQSPRNIQFALKFYF